MVYACKGFFTSIVAVVILAFFVLLQLGLCQNIISQEEPLVPTEAKTPVAKDIHKDTREEKKSNKKSIFKNLLKERSLYAENELKLVSS